ncbi:alkaline phosphatase D family protein [Pyxidicoccus xibeiensis]|uniref:alkaline phosphatase D family protein n=1 Tax=Pyxidicoccus xibeiensis TaxID=2906759 RepID=UPI0020A6E4CE|nr:alkaline phosphatase D family protein [Pyxidicoccus xibeiensis]MCP3138925.1 alkaline phosphatase D family protein [Pyxidicoccus xibeiensis]
MFDKFKRRSFLQAVVAVAASTAVGCSDEDESGVGPSDESAKYFPQSVASGDPRADSVVLWVRAVDPESPGANTALRLEVSPNEDFSGAVVNTQVTALAANDHSLKVKVTRLAPRTTYYYRFTFEKGGQKFSTATGRTRTAPAAGDDVPVKFAFASCQDYIGRYFNAWQRLLQINEDLDFVVFLGDYIYETTGDASFQSANGQRSVVFSQPEQAMRMGVGLTGFYAANSLSNYRDLYKNLRSDKLIQQVHERYPFIVMWDDHEFSDDCWGPNATYTDGRANEQQVDRRRNAEQAFFEYIPLDQTNAPEGAIDINAVMGQPTKVYRDFDFGKHLKLMVADYRTHRPDHIIPEDAYPGTVVIDAATLASLPAPVQAAFAGETFAYVNIDAAPLAPYKPALIGAYVNEAVRAGLTQEQAGAKATATITGNLSLFYVNQVIAAVNRTLPAAQQIPAIAITEATPRGVAYVHMGKSALFNIQGSRYIVVKPVFDLYAGLKYRATQGASENALGTEQQAWFQNTVKAANTWKVVVSSVSLTSMVFNLADKTDIPEANLRQAFYFSVDQWDGFPTKKQELLKYIRDNQLAQSTIFISGDIHASFASVESGVPALTAPAISSGSIKELAGLALLGAGYGQGAAVHRYIVQELEKTMQAANPGLKFADGDGHGFVVMEVKADEAIASFHLIPSTEITKDYTLRPSTELAARFSNTRFSIKGGAITAL